MTCRSYLYDHAAIKNTSLKTVVFKPTHRTLATLINISNVKCLTMSKTIPETLTSIKINLQTDYESN